MNNNMVVIELSASLLNVQENLNNHRAQKQDFDEKFKHFLEVVLRDRFFFVFYFCF